MDNKFFKISYVILLTLLLLSSCVESDIEDNRNESDIVTVGAVEQVIVESDVEESRRIAEERAKAESEAAESRRIAEEQARAESEAAESRRLAEEQARAESEAAESRRLAEQQANNVGDGVTKYGTPNGEVYHLDPDCGGKNSRPISNATSRRPCKKCAQ